MTLKHLFKLLSFVVHVSDAAAVVLLETYKTPKILIVTLVLQLKTSQYAS